MPNALTVMRLLCIPLFVWLLAQPNRSGWVAAALLLAVLGVTDGVDGYVARHFDQVSTVGKVLDPTADRLLLGVAAIAIVVAGAVPVGVAVAALSREALVAVGFLIVAAAGRSPDGRPMGRQGRHVRPHVRPAPVSRSGTPTTTGTSWPRPWPGWP